MSSSDEKWSLQSVCTVHVGVRISGAIQAGHVCQSYAPGSSCIKQSLGWTTQENWGTVWKTGRTWKLGG
jgi:hypothetical protein